MMFCGAFQYELFYEISQLFFLVVDQIIENSSRYSSALFLLYYSIEYFCIMNLGRFFYKIKQ